MSSFLEVAISTTVTQIHIELRVEHKVCREEGENVDVKRGYRGARILGAQFDEKSESLSAGQGEIRL
jgi:hypothetical protein